MTVILPPHLKYVKELSSLVSSLKDKGYKVKQDGGTSISIYEGSYLISKGTFVKHALSEKIG